MFSRIGIIIIGFSISFVFCLFTTVPVLAQESSWQVWAGLAAGGSLGIVGCLYLFRAIRRSKVNHSKRIKNANLDGTQGSSRWMILAAVGGILLARLVPILFDRATQDFINNAVSAWIITSFSGVAFLIWRYLPKD